jgi:hypothetical protein
MAMDREGWNRIVERAKNYIVAGGEQEEEEEEDEEEGLEITIRYLSYIFF